MRCATSNRLAFLTIAAMAACSSSAVDQRPPAGSTGSGGAGIGLTGTGTGSSGTGISVSTGVGGNAVEGCVNLQCQQTTCANGATTSVSGTVYDPAGKVPLYNVVVFVPNDKLEPLKNGASCETCDGNFSGKPIAVALTNSAGKFKVDDMPAGKNIPLVIQVGKWRRQITIPEVTACADTPLADKNLTRLPKSKAEGDLPRIAIATGGSDALECLLRKIGVEDSEFTLDSGAGHVNLFAGYKAATTMQTGGQAATLPTADSLWSSLPKMMGYDMMLMACEGDDGISRTKEEYDAVRAYADQGGRIFGSHWHNGWIRPDEVPYPTVAKFSSGAHGFTYDVTMQVDDTFPKGKSFKDWLSNTGATPTPGDLVIKGAEHSVDAAVQSVSQRWIFGIDPDPARKTPMVQYFSFTTPVAQKECGRMVFSDLHVSAGGGDTTKVPYPTGCNMNDLSPQEKALEFMLFDLSSCVQKEDQEVVPPEIVK